MSHPLGSRRLLNTKWSVPSRSERLVSRPRVNALLTKATVRPLTIVTGPAGVGKTLAVADWVRNGGPPGPVVWVSLDDADSEAPQFWETLTLALADRFGDRVLRGLTVTDTTTTMMAAIHANLSDTLVLVLDGCEKLSGGSALAAIDELMAQPSPHLRMILLSRHDPGLGLHRLRLSDDLSEIRFGDLAFTADEARFLLGRWDVTLPERAAARLLDVTEGWAAALRLAAFSLCRTDDPAAMVEQFDGINLLVSDYVWDEVLGKLPTDVCDFLQITSISDRLSGQLARAISGNPASHQILQSLAREELLVQELDGSGWYRTHPLLTRVLRHRLSDERPELEMDGNRRASQWFADRGDCQPAIKHAMETRDWEYVGTVSLRCAASLIFSTDRTQLGDALAKAPPPFTHDEGELAVAQALAASLITHDAAASAMVERAEALLPRIPAQRRSLSTVALCVAQAFQAHHCGDAASARAAADEADRLLSGISAKDAHSWAAARPRVAMMRVGATLWAGEPTSACALSYRLTDGQPPDHPAAFSPTYNLGLLAFMEAVQERNVTAAETGARKALEIAIPRGRLRTTESQFAWLALGLTGLATGRVEEAHSSLDHAGRATDLNPNPHIAGMLAITRARLAVATGSLPTARRHLAEVDRLLVLHPGMSLVCDLATAAHVELELSCGSTDRARAALDAHHHGHGPTLEALVLLDARVLLASGSPENARESVTQLLEGPGCIGVAAWLVVSRAEDRLRRDARSIDAFGRALELAEDQGLLHPFFHPDQWLMASLRRHVQVMGTHHELAVRALALGPSAPAPKISPHVSTDATLTDRELSVLLHLPTMSSNIEIAQALSISANTVKQHLKSSYRKLGVGTRRDAVRVARDRGLLQH